MAANVFMYAELSQSVYVPANAPYLRFSYRIVGSRSCDSGGGDDYIWLYSNRDISQWYLDACSTAGWVTGTLDMTSEAGTSTAIYFEVNTDAHGGTVYFDDIGFVSEPTREVDYY
jgi:hypothetical protein